MLLLAITCGAAVANIYYAQPLLPIIGQALGVPESTAGLLVTASQVGYAIALAFVVPLGDTLERRRLVSVLLGATAVTLTGAALAPGLSTLLAALALVGLTSAVAQIVVPMAASLADDRSRGSVVGTVMSGLLIGILLARSLAGLVAEFGGWRAVFGLAAVVMVVLAVVVRLVLPPVPAPEPDRSYGSLLRSVLALIRTDPVLRVRMGLGAVGMGCFSILWTAVSFLLAGAPYNYGPAVIGLFGLAGLAGAAAAPVAGKLADRGHSMRTVTLALGTLVVSWAALGFGGVSLIALLVGIVLLDLAQQSLQISHQSAIYSRHPDARSRVTTAFVVSVFFGGAIGSAAAAALYGAGGWVAVCVFGGVVAVVGLAVWLWARRRGIAMPAAV
ncbi:putative MFS family arabinose efflux permease [Pseudonocardia sediminis]|uniref:Putative MFS family arabinose efflux permease n=1 Tax=Pseudonocardia sediminis TaxID=1397368 RepID=A0A4Q7UTP4_PSEST|nr:MFS transporter [Pseudonocardia sediminis]RZT84161.1 putative MFS family arabinose efflux permease [Pseudonocardia sediminis]